MLKPADPLKTIAAAMLSAVCGCSDDQDSKRISAAQETCIRLARDHLKTLTRAGEPTFREVANVSSDPAADAFEFRWSVEESTLVWTPPETAQAIKFSGSVGCRGFADKKIITRLSVAGETIASTRSY